MTILRIESRSPRINPITAIAIIMGTAAITRARSGTSAQVRTDLHSLNSSATDVKIGLILSFRVDALACVARVNDAVPAAIAIVAFFLATISLRLSSRVDINLHMVYGYIKILDSSRRRILQSFYKIMSAWGWCAFWVGCCTKVMRVLLVLVVGDGKNGVGLTC